MYSVGTDGVGSSFLKALSLIVATDRHRKAEANEERDQRQCGCLDEVEIRAVLLRKHSYAS
jgi:hypothetical protein